MLRSHRSLPICVDPGLGRLSLAAALALAIGCMLYAIERDPASVWLMPAAARWPGFGGLLPRWLAGSLPTFCYVFTFALLTAACLGSGRGSAVAACASWLAVDLAFEIGQLPHLAARVAASWGDASGPMATPLRIVAAYLRHGVFDPLDLAAAVLGAAAAYAVITARRSRR